MVKKTDYLGEKVDVWCKKTETAGYCFCIVCNNSVKYASDGFKGLFQHSRSAIHEKARNSVKQTQVLGGSYPGNEELLKEDERTVDLLTRKSRAEAVVWSFIAEHSLSFSLAPEIIELCKTLSHDMQSVNSLKLSRTTVAYKLKYGLAKTIKDEQWQKLKCINFSLNLDESTSRGSQSILAILVQYFCENENKIILRHLASVQLNCSTAIAIYSQIVSVIEENNIPWTNLVSVLMDSCNTMRGEKSGVEKRLRNNKAPIFWILMVKHAIPSITVLSVFPNLF